MKNLFGGENIFSDSRFWFKTYLGVKNLWVENIFFIDEKLI